MAIFLSMATLFQIAYDLNWEMKKLSHEVARPFYQKSVAVRTNDNGQMSDLYKRLTNGLARGPCDAPRRTETESRSLPNPECVRGCSWQCSPSRASRLAVPG